MAKFIFLFLFSLSLLSNPPVETATNKPSAQQTVTPMVIIGGFIFILGCLIYYHKGAPRYNYFVNNLIRPGYEEIL